MQKTVYFVALDENRQENWRFIYFLSFKRQKNFALFEENLLKYKETSSNVNQNNQDFGKQLLPFIPSWPVYIKCGFGRFAQQILPLCIYFPLWYYPSKTVGKFNNFWFYHSEVLNFRFSQFLDFIAEKCMNHSRKGLVRSVLHLRVLNTFFKAQVLKV